MRCYHSSTWAHHIEPAPLQNWTIRSNVHFSLPRFIWPARIIATVEIYSSQRNLCRPMTSPSPEFESSFRVQGPSPSNSDHLESSWGLARALLTQICGTRGTRSQATTRWRFDEALAGFLFIIDAKIVFRWQPTVHLFRGWHSNKLSNDCLTTSWTDLALQFESGIKGNRHKLLQSDLAHSGPAFSVADTCVHQPTGLLKGNQQRLSRVRAVVSYFYFLVAQTGLG